MTEVVSAINPGDPGHGVSGGGAGAAAGRRGDLPGAHGGGAHIGREAQRPDAPVVRAASPQQRGGPRAGERCPQPLAREPSFLGGYGVAAARDRAARRHRPERPEPRLRRSALGDRYQDRVLRRRRQPALARHHHLPAGTAGGHQGRGRGGERAGPAPRAAASVRSDLREPGRLQRLAAVTGLATAGRVSCPARPR